MLKSKTNLWDQYIKQQGKKLNKFMKLNYQAT